MAWRFVGEPYRYEGGGNPSTDVDFGYMVHLRSGDGLDRIVNVELASGADVPLTIEDAKRIVSDYLADEQPPPRLVVARDGEVFASD